MSRTVGLIIAGVLALALVVYVFAGGSRRRADSAPHCTSPQALDGVKDELFRRAAAVRGSTDPTFDAVGRDSVVRAGSRLLRRHHPSSKTVTCTGTLVLDLPPGAAVVGGQHSLTANLAYDLGRGPGGSPRLLTLSNAEPMVARLATVTGPAEQAATIAASQANEALAEMPPPQTWPSTSPPAAQTVPRRAVAAPAPPSTQAEQKPARARPSAKPQPPKAARPSKHKPSASAERGAATAKPSFDCRKARTRSEIAVCASPGLAELDRAMSAEFYRALRAADPAQRDVLRASRTRFLAYRNSCGSDACIADAYRGHMAEIADIMARRW